MMDIWNSGKRSGCILPTSLYNTGRLTVREDGFSLLEVMVSIGILSILFVTLLGLRNRDIDLNGYAANLTIGTLLARQKMAEIELDGFPELSEFSGEFGEEYPGFAWSRTVSPTIFEDAREVRVTVTWKRGKKEESVDLTTYMVRTVQ